MLHWMTLGYKVLGLVAGRIRAESTQDLAKINLQNIKRHTFGMRLLGLAVISNPLRSDSTAAITELQDRYVCMCIYVCAWMHACQCLCMFACMCA